MKNIHSLGVMTGTSCDGADGAGLAISPRGERLTHTSSRAFPPTLRRRLRDAQRGALDIRCTALLTRDYSEWIAKFCVEAFKRWKPDLRRALIAVHGQTVWHEAESRISVQLLDPAIVAARTGITVTAAFRQPDLARHGQGAPLVPYYHWLRARSLTKFGRQIPFVVHNVGGIGNMTYVTRESDDLIAFDTGPGNALIDMAVEKVTHGAQTFDRDGKIGRAHSSEIDWRGVERLARHRYFKKAPPKSTGRELFNEEFLRLVPGSGRSRVANATALTAHTMAKAYADFIVKRGLKLRAVFVAGGGASNPFLMTLLAAEVARLTSSSIRVSRLPEAFAPPQSLEAMAFARFGYEALHGRAVSLTSITGAASNGVGAGIFPGDNYASLLEALDARR